MVSICIGSDAQWKAFLAHYYNSAAYCGKGVTVAHKADSALLSLSVPDIECRIFPDSIWRWEGMTGAQEHRWQQDMPIGNYRDYDESTPPAIHAVMPNVAPVEGSVIKMPGSEKELAWHMNGSDIMIDELPDGLPGKTCLELKHPDKISAKLM